MHQKGNRGAEQNQEVGAKMRGCDVAEEEEEDWRVEPVEEVWSC